MTWFNELMGFEENSPEQVRANIFISGTEMKSMINGRAYTFGELSIPSLNELRDEKLLVGGMLNLSETVADVKTLHLNQQNEGAVFQVASQFNLLEMVSPEISPEDGVSRYAYDYTQGPACAIACGAGTIYRNYFVEINENIGQTSTCQIDCLSNIAEWFDNENHLHWKMKNGYMLPSKSGLEWVTKKILSLEKEKYEELKGLLRIGVQRNTQVTLNLSSHLVNQVFCSALPIAYTQIPTTYWEAFARLVLDATYEATFWVALQNYIETGNNKLYLTLVGGGAFGNPSSWIKRFAFKKYYQIQPHTSRCKNSKLWLLQSCSSRHYNSLHFLQKNSITRFSEFILFHILAVRLAHFLWR
ncbi:MAG: hypothetical protein R2795_10780 [Saprospiraceae bacterium]